MCVVGTGSLARATCASISATWRTPATVVIVGRDRRRAEQAALVATTRAALGAVPVHFRPAIADLTDESSTEDMLSTLRPDVAFLCASLQSPWERDDAPSAWTELLAAGFGLTLPLQADLALRLSAALRRACPSALLVNACYPDAVNPVLSALDLPVHCGIGNAAILAASLQASLGLADQTELRVLAHHAHLHPPAGEDGEALAWLGTDPVPEVTTRLAPQRAIARRELNQITGHATAQVLEALVSGAPLATSLPGPYGLPGGYPVMIRGPDLALRLPTGLDQTAAIAWNQQAALRDGVRIHAGAVMFAPMTEKALRPHLPERAGGFRVEEIGAVRAELLALREQLRGA